MKTYLTILSTLTLSVGTTLSIINPFLNTEKFDSPKNINNYEDTFFNNITLKSPVSKLVEFNNEMYLAASISSPDVFLYKSVDGINFTQFKTKGMENCTIISLVSFQGIMYALTVNDNDY